MLDLEKQAMRLYVNNELILYNTINATSMQ
jgi:hypothetical protein